MNKIIWKDDEDIVAGTTLRDAQAKEDNNMALHVGGNLTDVIANRQRLSEDLGIYLNQWVFAQQGSIYGNRTVARYLNCSGMLHLSVQAIRRIC